MKIASTTLLIAALLPTIHHAQSIDYEAEIAAANKKIEEIRVRVSPAVGVTEADVLARFGKPEGVTTSESESKYPGYDVDQLGFYRWFYKTRIYRKDKDMGLTVSIFDMVVYFIEGKVIGSTLEIYPGTARSYVSVDGVVETYSGLPPSVRRRVNGSLGFDFHVKEGILKARTQLVGSLERYEAFTSTKNGLNKAPEPTTTAVTPPAAQKPREP